MKIVKGTSDRLQLAGLEATLPTPMSVKEISRDARDTYCLED
jgi:hypothetical protein